MASENLANIYGKTRFSPQEAKVYVDRLIFDYVDHYKSLGYIEEPQLPISSGIDDTVVFIGSGISVLKPFLLKNEIPKPGVVIAQNCIRARNVNNLLNDEVSPMWGSYFTNLLTISPSNCLKEASFDTFDFFEKRLGISSSNMLIRINSKDTDLIEVCRERYGDKLFEFDTKPDKYYHHKIGFDGTIGRNFNLALKRPGTQEYFDIGNFIFHTLNGKDYFVEIGFGTSTILKELYGLDHVQDCTPVLGLESIEDLVIRRKLEDAIVTCTMLYCEGLKPYGRDNRNRILKQYIRAISYCRSRAKLPLESLAQVLKAFEISQFPLSSNLVFNDIIIDVADFENSLRVRTRLSDNELKIKQILPVL